MGLESLSLSPSVPCSRDSLANSVPPSPAQQGGPPSQLSRPLGTGTGTGTGVGVTPGSRRGSLPSQAAGGTEAATGGESPGGVAPQGPTGGGALPEGKSQEGAGSSLTPTSTVSEGGPGKEAAAPELPPPESDGAHSEPRRELQATGQQAAAPTSGVSCVGCDGQGWPAKSWTPCCAVRL